MDDYDLPNTPKKLAKLSKDVNVANDIRFVKLFKEIRKKAYNNEYEPVTKLISWLTNLKENNYNVDINLLKN